MLTGSSRIKKRIAISAFLVLMILFLLYMLLRNNIHTVSSGELYRSAQLSPSRLKRLIRSDHIRTIINLRGSNPSRDWYRDELSVSRSMGVQHYDIRLSSTILPTPAQLHRLVDLYQTVPKPILLHCQGGADRTGFASATWLLMKGRSLAEAKQSFSILYFVHNPKSIGKQVVPIYRRWLEQHHYKTSATHFYEWVAITRLGK